MSRGRVGRTLAAVLAALFVPRVVLALLLVPPWQHPDEPQNVVFIRLLKANDGQRTTSDLITRFRAGLRDDPATEPLVVGSMAQHGWWTHYGRPTPHPPPDSLQAPADVVRADFGLPGGGTAYFAAFAWLFDALAVDDLMTQLYVLRAFSAFLGALAIVAATLAARLMFGGAVAVGVAAFLALHPQFLLVSTAANPDALVNAFGALAWYLTARLFTGAGLLTAAGVVVSALAAGVVKRVGLPVLLAAAMATLAWLGSRSWRQALQTVAVLALAAAAGVALLATTMPEEFARLLASTSFFDERWNASVFTAEGRLWAFSSVLASSAWLYAGWLRYPPPGILTAAWMTLTGVAAWGAVRRWRRTDTKHRQALALAVVYVAAPVAATYIVHFPIGSGAQGRYLFPAIAPFAALISAGWCGHGSADTIERRLLMLVVATAALDVIGWATVLLPAYT